MDARLSSLSTPVFTYTAMKTIRTKPSPKVYPFLNQLLPKSFIHKYFNKKL